jgi:hypothetical protein
VAEERFFEHTLDRAVAGGLDDAELVEVSI